MQRTIVPGIGMWSVWQPERNLFFNSFFVAARGGNLAIDPLPLSDADAAEIEAHGGLAWVVVTNRDHERDARALAARFGAKLAASALDAPLLTGSVDRALAEGEMLSRGRVVMLEGFKTPGEFALHFADGDAVVIGDALWGDPAGSLRLMPDDKLADPPRAVLSLRALRALLPEHILVGDGACIFGGANRVLGACLDARGDAYVNRVNRDDAVWTTSHAPWGYGESSFDIGFYLGAEKLGYQLIRIPPQSSPCPLHWHAAEEELFVVMAGTATLVTPRGEFALRAGDYVAFPVRERGAHKVVNTTQEPCEILMVSNVDKNDTCYYPDSKKVLIEATGLMLRDHPALDYWDGE